MPSGFGGQTKARRTGAHEGEYQGRARYVIIMLSLFAD
jgi:hypothetical protein